MTSLLHARRRARRTLWAAGLAVLLAAPVLADQAPDAPVLAIDVQVVDRDGAPIAGITPDKFNVEIAGRRRRVLSAQPVDGLAAPVADSLEGRQVYFVVVDAGSFGPGASNAAIEAMKTFAATLRDGSLVGLVTFPTGPSVELTADHASIIAALDGIAGQRPASRGGQFGVGLSDIFEYTSSSDPTAVTRTFCGTELAQEDGCPQNLEQEINAEVNGLEAQARASLGRLADFSKRLASIPGRKVVVLASAGVPIAERSGGRPDVGTLPVELAEAATRADVAVYTLLLDRLPDSEGGARRATNASRDRELRGRWLEQFSSSMGGALVRVQAGQAGDAYGRIARETTSYYRLTVESTDADTADRPQRLRVRVDQRGATVRSRTLVKGRE